MKRASIKNYILYYSMYMTSSKRQKYSDGNRSVVDEGNVQEESVTTKVKLKEFFGGDGAVLYPDCGGSYMDLYMC